MKGYDNQGRLVSDQSVCYTSDGKCVSTTTAYDGYTGRVLYQNVAVRDSNGKVSVTDVLGGKLLP